jgi:hypothetical protein
MIPASIQTEYEKYKALKFNCYIIKDNIRNVYFVSLLQINMHKNNLWLEIVK